MYSEGSSVVKQDNHTAFKYFEKAAEKVSDLVHLFFFFFFFFFSSSLCRVRRRPGIPGISQIPGKEFPGLEMR